MPETINTTSPELINEDFNEKLRQCLDVLSLKIPEIAETREAIEDGSSNLAEEFGLKPELLDDEAHSMYFVALAQRNGNLIRRIASGQSAESLLAEKEFIFDAMALISLEKSSKYDQFTSLIGSEEKTTAEYDRAIYEKYTNQEVTSEIMALINNGLLDEVKSRLGITHENEDPYEIKVLNIGNQYAYHGMMPRHSDSGATQLQGDFVAGTGYEKSYADYVAYRDRLRQTTQSFLEESKMGEQDVPLAWKTEIDGVNTLVLPLPVAEMLLDPEGKIKGDKIEVLDEITSIIEHEYIHTQSRLYLDGESLVGIALEELRAEHYSGNKQGYGDCKSAATYIMIATGFDLIGEMDKLEKGGDCAEMFAEISNNLGLQQALELNLSYPGKYVDKTSKIITGIDNYLGGLNGYITRLCENDRFRDRSERRFEEYAGVLTASSSVESLVDFYKYDSNINSMPYAAGKMVKMLEAQKSQ
jgi:hypothetical protein